MKRPFLATASVVILVSTLGCASAPKPAAVGATATTMAEGSCGAAMGKAEGCCGATKKTPMPEGCFGPNHKAGATEASCGEGSCGTAPAPK